MEQEIGTWDSVLLENLSEDSFINNIQQRYKRDHIYTYIGTSVVAVNPYHHISEHSLENIRSYGSKGIFQLPPHIYGLTNLAFQSLKDQSEDQCILLTGESGAGKTESFKMIVNFLTHIQEKNVSPLQIFKKQSSVSSTSANMHRRTSSSCSATNFILCKNPTSTIGTMSCSSRRQSPSPGAVPRRCDNTTYRTRAESSDRQSNRNMREKFVDFDFSHHKSTENISLDSLSTTYGYMHIHADKHPAKSCFKHQHSQMPCTATPSKSSGTMSSSPKYISGTSASSGGCRLCGHSKCIRAQSLEKDERELLLKATRLVTPPHQLHTHRGSCSNLTRQHSTENPITKRSSLVGSTQRISLYDAHKLSQTTASAQTSPSLTRNRHKTPSQKLRECVSYADVFLEAMGNASTMKNNNSSRYGKLFDIEIDFKGDPIGVHITHYQDNEHNYWRAEFSHILSVAFGCRFAIIKIFKTLS